MPSELERRILEVVDEQGPVTDEALAHALAEDWDADEVSEVTFELETNGLIQSSQASPPPRWQITDEGRDVLGGESDA